MPYRTEWIVYDWEYKLAGTIDFVDYQNGEYTIYDWKRSDKIIASGMPIKINKYGEKGNYPLEHIDNSPYYHYALQLSLYKFILERNYGIKVDKLRLGIFHPTYNKPYLLEVPYLENEINTILICVLKLYFNYGVMAKIFYIITLAILLISCNSNNGKTKQVSTIDSTLQVSVDSILQNKLSELDATIGQVIIMEVQTGEIKAFVGSDSILQESGLVRTASLLAALETKTVKLSDTIDVP